MYLLCLVVPCGAKGQAFILLLLNQHGSDQLQVVVKAMGCH